jgi:hypothetical protein
MGPLTRPEEGIDMAAVAEQLHRTRRRRIGVAPKQDEVVAVVLSDGTVRDLRGGKNRKRNGEFLNGTISGPDWTLWWERRSFRS